MVKDIDAFSNISILQTYLRVWALRPYVTGHLAQMFLRLANAQLVG